MPAMRSLFFDLRARKALTSTLVGMQVAFSWEVLMQDQLACLYRHSCLRRDTMLDRANH